MNNCNTNVWYPLPPGLMEWTIWGGFVIVLCCGLVFLSIVLRDLLFGRRG